ncbi:MAG: tRNA (guanine(10)-N(2))-dimethyltransferase [Candidatus Bathyarchaeia archaeon]
MKFQLVSEGKIKIRVPVHGKPERSMAVFYNANKKMDRSLSVALLQAFLRGPREVNPKACDLLAATGVRGLRLASEVFGLNKVILNDVNPTAFELMKQNVKINEKRLRCVVEVKSEEANHLLRRMRTRFDYLDVDPFGSPNPFLDAAVRSVRLGGILAVSSTDTACLCGTYPKTCYRKYGSLSHKTEYFRETGVRILAKKVIEVGAQYYNALQPIFAHTFRDSFRLYFVASRGAERTDQILENIGFILHCDRCLFRMPKGFDEPDGKECPRCESRLRTIGPLYMGKLYDRKLVEAMRDVVDVEAKPLLRVVFEESAVDSPWYYTTDAICSRLGIPAPKIEKVINVLRGKGLQAARTHFDSVGIKTDASMEEMEQVLRSLG